MGVGLGFGGSRFTVQGSRFRVQGSGFTVQGLGGREMKIERFEDIEAWRLARELTRKVKYLTVNREP